MALHRPVIFVTKGKRDEAPAIRLENYEMEKEKEKGFNLTISHL